MAENSTQRQAAPGDVTPTDQETSARAQAAARAAAREDTAKLTETVPGGKYKVGDTYVDANGFPLKDQG